MHTFSHSFALYLAEMRVRLLDYSWITSPANVRQVRFHLLDIAVHRNNGFGGSQELSIPRPTSKNKGSVNQGIPNRLYRALISMCTTAHSPNESTELLLIAGDVTTEILFRAPDSRNWVLERFLP